MSPNPLLERKVKRGTLYTDGASSGNPGESGIGIVLSVEGKKFELSEYIGRSTNNVAEYTALIRGLQEARNHGIDRIDIFLDSELLVKQIRGEYSVKSESLKPLFNRVSSILKTFRSYSIRHIPREENADADRLARRAIKKAKI